MVGGTKVNFIKTSDRDPNSSLTNPKTLHIAAAGSEWTDHYSKPLSLLQFAINEELHEGFDPPNLSNYSFPFGNHQNALFPVLKSEFLTDHPESNYPFINQEVPNLSDNPNPFPNIPIQPGSPYSNTGTETNVTLQSANPSHNPAPSMLMRRIAVTGNPVLDTDVLVDSVFGIDKKRYIISKSSTKTIIPPSDGIAAGGLSGVKNTNIEGNMQPIDIASETQFPFEIYLQSQSLFFDRSDGTKTISVSTEISSSVNPFYETTHHVLCQKSSSIMQIWFDGIKVASNTDNLNEQTRNKANLYIGTKGNYSRIDGLENEAPYPYRYFHGELSNINIFEEAFDSTTIVNISESINASPYIGNIFYQNGFATITHPKYHHILDAPTLEEMAVDDFSFVVYPYEPINKLQFQGSHLIFENEYQCTIEEHEFNSTLNTSARKEKTEESKELANFTTGSLFKPYITTVGLYNELGDLLVVGKLGQPFRTSNETDTTIVLRWDT